MPGLAYGRGGSTGLAQGHLPLPQRWLPPGAGPPLHSQGTLHWSLVTAAPLLDHELFLSSFSLEWALEDARNELTNDPGIAWLKTKLLK